MNYLSARLLVLLKHTAVIVVLLFLMRILFAINFVPFSNFVYQVKSIPLAVFNALRFDLQIAAYLLLLPFIISIISQFVRNEKTVNNLNHCTFFYFVTMELLLLILSIIDIGFYRNFNTHINITFFDFFNEGPISLLQTIYEEYHVIFYLLLLIAAGLCLYALAKRIERGATVSHKRFSKKTLAALIFFIFGEAVCLRGSVWNFPLQAEDSFVSTNTHINELVPNAVYMLKKAIKEKINAFKERSVEELLTEYKFNSLQEAIDVYAEGDRVVLKDDTLNTLYKVLFKQVPDTLMRPQPNVLIILCESWSNYLMKLDSPRHNLLFGMRKHLKEDLFFQNFQSVGNGTIASIENMVCGTPFPRLFSSPYRFKCLPSSIALPFNESGYTTEFISGMDIAWENCAEALTHQKFTKLCGKFTLLEQHPEYDFNCIGIYDHHLFQSIQERLNRKTDKPQMMLAVTTTNHPPFVFPNDIKIKDLPDDFYNNPCFSEKDKEVLRKYITGFRYANRTLADFLDKFKQSKATQNTIIVVTGDHNVRSILDYGKIDKRWERSVPLYIYLPPYLRKESYAKLTQRYGSHDDIVPTLAPFAFRHTRFMRLGMNLLDEKTPDTAYYSANCEKLLASPTQQASADRKVRARNLLRLVFFQIFFAKKLMTEQRTSCVVGQPTLQRKIP